MSAEPMPIRGRAGDVLSIFTASTGEGSSVGAPVDVEAVAAAVVGLGAVVGAAEGPPVDAAVVVAPEPVTDPPVHAAVVSGTASSTDNSKENDREDNGVSAVREAMPGGRLGLVSRWVRGIPPSLGGPGDAEGPCSGGPIDARCAAAVGQAGHGCGAAASRGPTTNVASGGADWSASAVTGARATPGCGSTGGPSHPFETRRGRRLGGEESTTSVNHDDAPSASC